ncbi:MAG TPA: TolC family protein [Blastocatellia bacterium]|nr:TolC family protein [Blastocatellia bacterium]
MLRITEQSNSSRLTLKLAGTLSGDWALELERYWRSGTLEGGLRRVRIDLADVVFVDDIGRVVLAEIAASGAELVAGNLVTEPIVEGIYGELQPFCGLAREGGTKMRNVGLIFLPLIVVLAMQARAGAQTRPAVQSTQPRASSESESSTGARPARPFNLTLQDAVTMALQNNREIESERIGVQMNEFDVTAAKGAYDPTLSSSFFYEKRKSPVASLFSGGQNGVLNSSDVSGSVDLTQRLKGLGSTFKISFDHDRYTSDNLFFAFDPVHTSSLTFEFVQPLARNRRIDEPRRQLRIAKKRLNITDSQFRQHAIEIVTKVQQSYWDLVFARRDQEIKRDAVDRARQQLEHTERMIAQGTVAPVEATSVRVELERRTDEFEAAIEAAHRAENALKSLVLPSSDAEQWNFEWITGERLEFDSSPLPSFSESVKVALANRPELEQNRLRAEVNKTDIEFYRDQTRPQIDFVASYSMNGLAGKERSSLNPIAQSTSVLFDRVNELSQQAGLPALTMPVDNTPSRFIGGYGTSLNNMLRNDFRTFRFGVTINLPFGNHTAKGQLGRALAEGRQINTQRESVEQSIAVEVRNSLQSVETSRRRFEAARNSRLNAEAQLASEQRRFEGGLSTVFFVLDRQNAYSSAQMRELKALTDCHKAMIELQRTLSTTLSSNNISLK